MPAAGAAGGDRSGLPPSEEKGCNRVLIWIAGHRFLTEWTASMLLVDVNVLTYAYREEMPGHRSYLNWLRHCVESERPYGLSDLVLSGFVRVVTHPGIFSPPSPLKSALQFVNELRAQPNCVIVAPGPRHWEIFNRLCQAARATGNLVADAYLAALAIESGSELITADRDFARFPGLRWRHPLQ